MKFLAGALVFFAGLNLVCADPGANPTNDWRIHFEKGKHEGLAGVGVFFSPVLATTGRPTENYAGPLFQLGYMLNDPGQDEWRGSFEFAGELYGGGIFLGRGHYVANATLWLRYNLIPPDSRWIPYIQLGAGVTLTDADQGSFGQVFNFNEGAALGVRYFIKPDCSLNGEYRFHHISNAGLSEHNLGINAHGPVASVSWYF